MIQILYQGGHGSHGPRSEALASVTPLARASDIATQQPTKIPGLETLIFWGHGDSLRLCGKTASEIHQVIKDWKKLNSSLKNIEVITCNARHASGGDPFVKQLKSKFGILSGTNGLKLKALPTYFGGTNNAWSILLAEATSKTWIYLTAPGANDAILMQAKSLVEFDQGPRGSISYRGELISRAQKVMRENPTRQWTINYGPFSSLRNQLNAV